MNQKIIKQGKLHCVISYPDNFDSNKKYPTIICLHGAGYRGNDISVLQKNPFFLQTEKIKNFDFVLIAPQCSADTWFDLFEELKKLTFSVVDFPYVDKTHFYMMGASMGAYATWQLAMSIPEYFAAIAPICGGGMYWNAGRLKDVPVWAFHGDIDDTVFCEESEKMVSAVKKIGGEAQLTIYKNCGHNAWDYTYSNPELYKWFLKHSK